LYQKLSGELFVEGKRGVRGEIMNNILLFKDDDGKEREDFFNSGTIIDQFSSLLKNTDFSVYAVSGDWGTGKTCFIKMWENKISSEGLNYIHIDAYKMDYETEPFMMFIKAFKDFMNKNKVDEKTNKEWLEKAKNIFTMKNIGKLGLNILLEKMAGFESIKNFINDTYNDYFEKLSNEQSLYDELRTSLQNITERFKENVYIVIDELDRCRPDFALETLERIKHLFNVTNVKFILVYNEEVIKSAIHNRYGEKIDARKYLDKFVQKTYELDNAKYFLFGYTKLVALIFQDRNSIMANILLNHGRMMTDIKEKYNLTFRDMNIILNNLLEYKNGFSDSDCVVLISLEILKKINEYEYKRIIEYYKENGKIFDGEKILIENFNTLFNSLKTPYMLDKPDEFLFYFFKQNKK